MVIQAESAAHRDGREAKVTINGLPVKFEKNINGHFRGLYIVVINPANGKVEKAKIFDPYMSHHEFDEFTRNDNIPTGHIVVATMKDEFVMNLSHQCR